MFAVLALVVLCVAPVLRAQEVQPPPPPATVDLGPAPEDVLKHVPAGCMGFVYVRSAQDLAGAAEKFMDSINVTMQGQPMIPPVRILALLRQQLGLGDVFDPRGGFAAVMLDAQQYDLDLVKAVSGEAAGITFDKVPLVMLVPGKDPAKMFATRNPGKDGEVDTFAGMDGKPRYCKQLGGYVALSANKKAMLDFTAGKAKSVVEVLSAEDKGFIADNAAAVWVNYKLVGPIVDAMLADLEKKAAEARKGKEGPMGGIMGPADMMAMGLGPSVGPWRPVLRQLDSLALGLRFTPDGAMVDARGQFAAASELGKLYAAVKPAAKGLLTRIPGLPYVFAFGMTKDVVLPRDIREKQADATLAQDPFKKLKPETQAKFRKLMLDSEDIVKGAEMLVATGGPDKGVLRVAMVIDASDAAKVREMTADAVPLVEELIKVAEGETPSATKFTLKYAKAAETLGERKVDLMTVEFTGMDEEGAKALKAMLGDDKIHVRLADVDAKTVVLTVGGGTSFLGEAIAAAAAKSGKLEEDSAVKAALARLPAPRQGVILVSPKNIVSMIHAIEAATGKPVGTLQLASDAPFAAGIAIQGSGVRVSVHAPSATIKAIITGFLSSMMGGAQEGPPPGF